jgi:hypothetical protein
MEKDHQEPEYNQEEVNQVIAAAHALKLDAPITAYRIVGNRIELWTAHGGPYTYDPTESPASAEQPPSKTRKLVSKTKKPASKKQ